MPVGPALQPELVGVAHRGEEEAPGRGGGRWMFFFVFFCFSFFGKDAGGCFVLPPFLFLTWGSLGS